MAAYSTFGEQLRNWRLDQGLSQQDFGELLDPKVRPSTVCCWENDVRCPSWRFVGQILTLTGIPADLALRAAEVPQEGQP